MAHRVLAVPILVLLPLSCSKHADPCGGPVRPAPEGGAVTLQPIATEATGSARIPGAPAGCVGKFFVRAPRAVCPPSEVAPTDTYRGSATSDPPVEGARCWLGCMGRDPYVSWGLAVPDPGFRGSVSCEVEGGGSMRFELVDPEAGFSDSAGAVWLTQIGGDGYSLDLCTDVHYVTKMGCPAGQAARAEAGGSR